MLPQPGRSSLLGPLCPKAPLVALHPLWPTFYGHLPPGKLKAMAPLPDCQGTSLPTTPSPAIVVLLGVLCSPSLLLLSLSLCLPLSLSLLPSPCLLSSLLLHSLRNTRSLDGLMYLVLTKASAKKVV